MTRTYPVSPIAINRAVEGSGEVLVCRACGHREHAGTFYGAVEDEDLDAEEAAAAEAAWRKQHRRERREILARIRFPIFELDDRWSGARSLGGWGGGGDEREIHSVRIRHREADSRWIEVASGVPEHGREDVESALRSALMNADATDWPDASEGAVSLWLRARERAVDAEIAAAARSTMEIPVEGSAREFTLLEVPGRAWAASVEVDVGLADELGSRDGSGVPSAELKRLGLVPPTEVLRNG